MLKKMKTAGGPNPEDYKLPKTETEWNTMLMKMEECDSLTVSTFACYAADLGSNPGEDKTN